MMAELGWKWEDLIVCGYYTPGPYEKEAERLMASLETFDIPYDLTCATELKGLSWIQVTREKPSKILDAIDKYPKRPILFIDVDAVVLRDPRLIFPNSWEHQICSVTVHSFGTAGACSGTVICAPGEAARKGIEHWLNNLVEKPDEKMEQRILNYISEIDKLLAPEWCWIFDLSPKIYGQRDVIIEHLQASREFRGDRSGGGPSPLLLSRLKRLAIMEVCTNVSL